MSEQTLLRSEPAKGRTEHPTIWRTIFGLPSPALQNHASRITFQVGRMTNFFVNFVSFVLRNRMHKLFRRADELSHFHEMKLTDGIVRMILPGANRE
jgi:hypothetical protein